MPGEANRSSTIVLSDEFVREVTTHSIPTDLEAVKALSSAPAAHSPIRQITNDVGTDFGTGGRGERGHPSIAGHVSARRIPFRHT
jgi:hypothetical protein